MRIEIRQVYPVLRMKTGKMKQIPAVVLPVFFIIF